MGMGARFFGFSECYCYSFESPKVFDKLLFEDDARERNAIRISNPLGEDFSIMRTVSLNGILTSLSTNYNRRNKDVALYEFGNIYIADKLPLEDLPDERMTMTLGFYGDGDFYAMKGVVEGIIELLGMKEKLSFDANAGKNFLHPGRQASVSYKGENIGFLGEVHPMVLENYEIGERTYVAVIDLKSVVDHADFSYLYKGVPKFPAVTRDISMLVPKEIIAAEIEKILWQRGGKILEDASLFDIYEGEQVKEGCKSMAYSLTFRAADKTLTDDDVNSSMKKILNGLEGLGIELRS